MAGFNLGLMKQAQQQLETIHNEQLVGISQHAVESLLHLVQLRTEFTLRLDQNHPAFKEVADLFRPHFVRDGQHQQFEDACSGGWFTLLFVPAFEVSTNASRIQGILVQHKIQSTNQAFAWEYLKDQLRHCSILISGSGIEITPVLLPTPALSYLQSDVRRVYLTATTPSQVEFLRTFGVQKVERVTPGGKSGEAQRQFLFLPGSDDEERGKAALELVAKEKACIIAPSESATNEWCPPAIKFDKKKGGTAIRSFANAKPPEKLALAARYDGIDLRGDACRVLIISGLPVGETLIDRFIDQTLRIERLRTAHTATRLVQAIGRIFRSNTDHGAVLITSYDLERWLADPRNLEYMPALLQQQIRLGIALREMVEQGNTTFADLLSAVLSGRKDWDKLYSENVAGFEANSQSPEPQWLVEIVGREQAAFDKLWKGNHAAAAAEYSSIANDSESHEVRQAAWYRHWEGLALSLAGDIHGRADFSDDNLILGHVWNPVERASLNDRPDIEELDTRLIQANAILDKYFFDTFKPSARLIHEHRSFFEQLTNLEEVCVLGHSLSAVDRPYFHALLAVADTASAPWWVSGPVPASFSGRVDTSPISSASDRFFCRIGGLSIE